MKEDKLQLEPQHKKRKSSKPTIIAVGILILAAVGGSSFYAGLKLGEKRGAEIVAKKITDTLNPLNLLSNNPVLPGTVVGNISQVDSQSLTLKLANGDEKKLRLTDKTQVTQQSNTLKISDLKTGQQVTVFVKQDTKKDQALRVLVR